jgi:hypothetical protein
MKINRAIDDSIDDSEPLEPNPPRLELHYYKLEEDLDRLRQVGERFGSSTTSRRMIWIAYYKSKEDLDRLLQVREGLANIYRRAPIPPPPDYSDLINNAIPLSNGHRGLMAPPSWLGGLGHWKGTSPPNYLAQPTFLQLNLGRAGQGIGRARVLQVTWLSPPFCASILVGWARALEGHKSSKLPS